MFLGNLIGKQNDAAQKLCARKLLLLAFPQGTGKSVIALASAEKLLELGYIKNVIILCQTNIAWQWKDRINEFTDSEVLLTEAGDKASRTYLDYPRYRIIPYSLFRNDFSLINDLDLSQSVVVADEAQEFSSYQSKTLKCIKQIDSPYKWALTGTAISNKLEDLYNIMQWVDPTYLPPWWKFEKRHIVRNPVTKQIIKYKNLKALNKYLLAKRLERRSLSDLQELLPLLKNHTRYVDKDKGVEQSEKKLFKLLKDYKGTSSRFDGDLSRALHEARQELVNQTKLREAIRIIDSTLAESDSNRIVCFSFYKLPLYLLLEHYGEHAILYTGDDSSDDKQSKIKQFKSGARILLASKAGSTGLDLPFANYIIHLDVPFSFGNLDQRSKRIQRNSSLFEEVIVIQLLVKDSIEEYYYQVTKNKEQLSKATLEGGIDEVIVRPLSLKNFINDYQNKNRTVQSS